MNPLIGRTCTYRVIDLADTPAGFGGDPSLFLEPKHVGMLQASYGVNAVELTQSKAQSREAIIVDVQPAPLWEAAGNVSRSRLEGWMLLLLVDGGRLESRLHAEVTVT